MKKITLSLFALVFILLGYIMYILVSTGFFRTVENKFAGEIYKKIYLEGAEDMAISYSDSFAIVSSTNRTIMEEQQGDLYYLDLKNNAFSTINLSENIEIQFAPHGISMFKLDSSYLISAVNHTREGEFIEIFELQGQVLTHLKTISDPLLVSPNDIVMLDAKRFYFTNDHLYTKGIGKFLEEYAGYKGGHIIYYDGETFSNVGGGIAYANGINFDANRELLYVSSPRGFLIKVYKKNDDGSLEFVENIKCGTGIDNLELDEFGNIWTGGHPNLLKYKSYSKGKSKMAPSEILKIEYKEKGQYTVEQMYLDDGENMSAASFAAPFGDLILTGNVMDKAFLVLRMSGLSK